MTVANKWTDNRYRWGRISRLFHHVSAILVIGVLAGGWYMHNVGAKVAGKEVIMLHLSFGFVISVLMLLRLVWHLTNESPENFEEEGRTLVNFFLGLLASATHFLLYVGIWVQFLVGMTMVQQSGRTVEIFGVLKMPAVFGNQAEAWMGLPEFLGTGRQVLENFGAAHYYIAIGLSAMVGLHILGVIYHHVVLGDEILGKMFTGHSSDKVVKGKDLDTNLQVNM